MKHLFAMLIICGLICCVTVSLPVATAQEALPKPLRALLIAGGCCHDYANQQSVISQGIQARANVQVDVYWTDDSTTAPVLPLYQDPDWAKSYDVIIHDECAADVKDPAIVARIVQAHQKIPAVHLHCAMHSFRTDSDIWFKHLGLQFEFDRPQALTEIEINWEQPSAVYRYRVEGSKDGKTWSALLDKSSNTDSNPGASPLADNTETVFLRITGSGSQGGWCSIREVAIQGTDVKQLWPADPKQDGQAFVPLQPDPLKNQGNVEPRIVRLTPAQEAEILDDVRVPSGFEATVFAAPPAVNYPVFVAAAVDGTLYVSSDGNGSLGRDPKRGRVIRLRDTDGDGRADETKVFCEIDAPRGLVWDHDRLYLMHPPHLSAFLDTDGDGVADEQKILVKNLAFGYDQRPADHTTNGISLGADGWLYIAGGDFGFMDAEGADGRRLTHRGGGVIRVRPDGSGLEICSSGTRNILEVAISPQMDLFAQDNTNDGGGWDVRLHHFTGSDDHGYPRLYKNFSDECVQPVADYGGGSGCGAVYLDEPGFGDWNNAPLTADWGTGALYRHNVTASGATFRETKEPQAFVRMTRPTDADVDGNSRLYCASWRGATFAWEGTNVGYIVCVRPQAFTPEALPDFASVSDSQLIELMRSPSYRRRIEASRELMRRGNPAYKQLLEQALAQRPQERNLLDHLQGPASDQECLAALASSDPIVVHVAIHCLAKRGAIEACLAALDQTSPPTQSLLRALALMHEATVVDGLIARIDRAQLPEQRLEILTALCRLYYREGQWQGDSWGTRPDTRGPYYQPEEWNETPKIATALNRALDNARPSEVVLLVDTMRKNRIESSRAVERLIHLLDSQILSAAHDPDPLTAELAQQVVRQLKLAQTTDTSPKIGDLSIADALQTVTQQRGDLVLGQQIFIKANCAACHTTRQGEAQKGPFLGNIAKTYQRTELASAVLEPSKTIAQGFTTNTFLTIDGVVLSGFVTNELSDSVTLRDAQGKQITLSKVEIEERKTSPISIMPVGVMNEYSTHELASLLDYLQSLASTGAIP